MAQVLLHPACRRTTDELLVHEEAYGDVLRLQVTLHRTEYGVRFAAQLVRPGDHAPLTSPLSQEEIPFALAALDDAEQFIAHAQALPKF